MAISYLTLEDENGNSYSFHPSFSIVNDPWNLRSDIKEFIYANGGKQNGDRYVRSRKIIIEGILYADTQILFDSAFTALKKALLKGGKLSKSDAPTKYINVELDAFEPENEHPRHKNISITFDAPYPFWEDTTETSSINVVAGNDNFDIDVSASEHILLPVIEISADQGVDVPSVILKNIDDGGMILEYNNPLFLSGSTLIIDSKEGTIKLNNNLAMEYLLNGTFLRLQPKVNSIYYEGAACTITVKYRKVYL